MAYDVRAIANFVLDLAEQQGFEVSNLSVNKIVFFLHAYFLVQFRRPLVTAKIEAWNYGPVFRELYREFKKYGDQMIIGRATRIDPITGDRIICSCELLSDEREFLKNLILKYVKMKPGELVSVSHEKGGPWDQVWNHDNSTNATMHISNEVIQIWYAKAVRH